VIIACGLEILSEEGKLTKRKYFIHNVFWTKEEDREFHTLDFKLSPCSVCCMFSSG
jgi:hypothetical protein